jgi:DnaK suppressor protein
MKAERAQELLTRERDRIERELAAITPDASSDQAESTGDEAAEIYAAERDVGQAETLRAELAAVERAEQRLASGSYGLSVESGDAIPDLRLEAVPTAERTIAEQERFDGGR